MFTSRTRDANIVARPVGQPLELARLLAEALHDAHAGDVFLDDVGDVAGLLLRVPARREHRRAQSHRGDRAAAGATASITSDSGGDSQNIAPSETTNNKMFATPIGQELQEPLDQRDVGRRPAHELAGLQLVVAREVEALQLAEDRGAEVVLHVERDAAAPEPAEVREHERRRHPSRSSASSHGASGRSCARDHVVDHDLLHDRQQATG